MAADSKKPNEADRRTREWDDARVTQLEKAIAAIATEIEQRSGMYIDDEDVQAVKERVGVS